MVTDSKMSLIPTAQLNNLKKNNTLLSLKGKEKILKTEEITSVGSKRIKDVNSTKSF